MNIDDLNASFSIPTHLIWSEGPGGLPIATLSDGASIAQVALHGAHVLSFENVGHPVLWISEKAIFNGKKAIRGGVPVCWPWFADHPDDDSKPAHGVARISTWAPVAVGKTDNHTYLELGLTDSPETREIWNHSFDLRLRVTLEPACHREGCHRENDALTIALTAHNTNDVALEFGTALHSYFSISDVANVHLTGLENVSYIDSIDGGTRKSSPEPVRITEEVDRIYVGTKGNVAINDSKSQHSICVEKSGSDSTVVWNPWIDKAARMGDFGDNEYPGMVCVETTNAADDVKRINPGEKHTLSQTISLRPLI